MRVNLTQNSSSKHSRFHFCTQQRITKAQRANINDTHGIDGSPRTYRDHQKLQFIELLLLFILIIVDRLMWKLDPADQKLKHVDVVAFVSKNADPSPCCHETHNPR